MTLIDADTADTDGNDAADADAVTPSSNTRIYTLRSVPSSTVIFYQTRVMQRSLGPLKLYISKLGKNFGCFQPKFISMFSVSIYTICYMVA